MSGSLAFTPEAQTLGPHQHLAIDTSQGCLTLTDPRRFGAALWSRSLDHAPAASLLAGLGAEPFDPGLDAAALRAGFQGRRQAIKQALLGGDVVVGAWEYLRLRGALAGPHPSGHAGGASESGAL